MDIHANKLDNGKYKDVNAFETNYAAERDEEPVSRGKRLDHNDMSVVFEEKAEKVKNVLFRDGQIVKTVVHNSPPHTPPITPPLEGRSMQRPSIVIRSNRRGNVRDPTYIPPLPKTKH
ncbi:hypothetical protein OnM2_017097, partial [Erysiphe neolycopersici]